MGFRALRDESVAKGIGTLYFGYYSISQNRRDTWWDCANPETEIGR
jgi:hypothetical protein